MWGNCRICSWLYSYFSLSRNVWFLISLDLSVYNSLGAGCWAKPGKNEGMNSDKCSDALLWVLTLDILQSLKQNIWKSFIHLFKTVTAFKKHLTSLFITLGPKYFSFQLLVHPPKQPHIFCWLADRIFPVHLWFPVVIFLGQILSDALNHFIFYFRCTSYLLISSSSVKRVAKPSRALGSRIWTQSCMRWVALGKSFYPLAQAGKIHILRVVYLIIWNHISPC